jgi:hypothetical protein
MESLELVVVVVGPLRLELVELVDVVEMVGSLFKHGKLASYTWSYSSWTNLL